jgi:hypothetical protein
MTVASTTSVKVKQAVPFFGVTNMEASLRVYVDGLGFRMKHGWIPNREEDKPDGRIRWCWLELGEAAIMLQEFLPELQPKETLGTGASVSFMCEDALGALSRVQIAWNSDAETPIRWQSSLGIAAHRSRWLPH